MGRIFEHVDWITFVPILGISVFGLFVLLTLDKSAFLQQAFFVASGIILAFILSKIEPAVLWWLGPLFYAVSILFLLITYFAPEIRGAHRWFFVGSVQIQPSELAKPLFIIGFSRFISVYSPRTIRNIPILFVLFFPVFVLIYKQPDFGTAVIYGIIWLGMMLAGGLRLRLVISVLIIVGVVTPLVWGVLADYQKNRIYSFIDPEFDPKGAGYNAIQAVISVGSGELFGRGLGRGTQSHLRFLPENHTDFIFATIVEEFGFMGALLLLIIYFFLLWNILTPLLRQNQADFFGYITALGIFSMLLGQSVINIGMNMGIVPVTGITLPLVSYGGSSALATLASFGLLWSVRRDKPML